MGSKPIRIILGVLSLRCHSTTLTYKHKSNIKGSNVCVYIFKYYILLSSIFQVGGRRLGSSFRYLESFMNVMYGVGRTCSHLGTPWMFTTSLDVKTTKEGHELGLVQ